MNRNNHLKIIVTLGALMLMSTSAVAVVDNADSLYVGPGESYTLGGMHSYNVLVEVAATGTLNVTSYNGGAATGFLELNAPVIEILGAVNGDFRGFRTAEGPGSGNYPGSGGSYGGQGGASGWNTQAKPPYGTSDGHDIEKGSGGASQTLGVGGRGGAMVALYANSCDVSGQITVNGAQGSDVTGWGDGGGGGSGGGIFIEASDANISGTLSANGGRGGNASDSMRRGGGGGGGGRIKVFYCSLIFTGTHTEEGGIRGTGGSGNGGPGDVGTYYTGRNTNPVITAILDVENDQGRQVRITWDRTCLDDPNELHPVTHYTIWRRIDELSQTVTEPRGFAHLAWPPGDWDFVLDVPARGEYKYNAVVPTLADSNVAGMHWSTFFVSGVTADPFVHYDSDPDSGYSVDNLAPGVPEGLKVAYQVENQLTWLENEAEDFQYFKIYRGESEDFVPAPGNQVHATAATEWVDGGAGWGFFYKITAVDHNGNESEAATPSEVTGVRNGTMPTRTVLLGAVPNPFNPSTKLSFDIADAGHVRLKVYDPAGRLIATLVEGHREAGNHDVIWDGRDNSGRMSSAGVYLYRLETGEFNETKSMTLVK